MSGRSGFSSTDVDAVVIGAGFSGLYMLHKCRELGFSARAFEKGDDVGGTWYWNRYPGARCDIESHAYSYSFDPELEQDWEWTERYASQPEILQYLNHVADRYDLRRDIEFGTTVASAAYSEDSNTWTVATENGSRLVAKYLITAVGCLSRPKAVDIEGAGSFEPSYHTSNWPADGVDVAGKRLAVIGAGSSGIQVITELAKQAGHLTVFQRTPSFSLPAGNRTLSKEETQKFKANYRHYRQEQRVSRSGVPYPPPGPSALTVPDEERRRVFEAEWAKGSLAGIFLAYNDILTDERANAIAAAFVRGKIEAIVSDPEIADALIPKTYPIGTRRPCLDTGYYQTYNRPNVELVDLTNTPILRVTNTGITTTEHDFTFDAIVYATGFDAIVGALNAIDIRGKGFRGLRETWQSGPRSYLGLGVAGFPNMFTITGPGSPSVLSNMVVSIEQHVDWIAACMSYMRESGATAIEATEEAQDAWVAHVEEVAGTTLLPRTDSWYTGSNVPGKARVFMPYFGGVGTYRETCDKVASNDYEGFAIL